jgi:hypothetical protein
MYELARLLLIGDKSEMHLGDRNADCEENSVPRNSSVTFDNNVPCQYLFIFCTFENRWGTALQAGMSRVRFPMVSPEFLIDIIIPDGLWP